MSDVIYRSKVRIERVRGPHRLAWLPGEDDPVHFGVHSEIAEHYGIDTDRIPGRAATLDYLVAAAAG